MNIDNSRLAKLSTLRGLALTGSLSKGAIALMNTAVGFMLGSLTRVAGEEKTQA